MITKLTPHTRHDNDYKKPVPAKPNPNNHVVKPTAAQMLASPQADLDAVFYLGEYPTMDAKVPYVTVGQSVSLGGKK